MVKCTATIFFLTVDYASLLILPWTRPHSQLFLEVVSIMAFFWLRPSSPRIKGIHHWVQLRLADFIRRTALFFLVTPDVNIHFPFLFRSTSYPLSSAASSEAKLLGQKLRPNMVCSKDRRLAQSRLVRWSTKTCK